MALSYSKGIGTTEVKASIIKCATDTAGVTLVIENVLRAAARAQKATGVPISTHIVEVDGAATQMIHGPGQAPPRPIRVPFVIGTGGPRGKTPSPSSTRIAGT